MSTAHNGRINLSDQDLRDELRSRRVVWTTLLAVATFVTWAYFAEIDEITRAPGEVVSSSRTQLVQSQDGGVLKACWWARVTS